MNTIISFKKCLNAYILINWIFKHREIKTIAIGTLVEIVKF